MPDARAALLAAIKYLPCNVNLLAEMIDAALSERETEVRALLQADADRTHGICLDLMRQRDEAREDQRREDAEIVRQLTRVDDRLEAGYECGWNAACKAGMDAILRGKEGQ